jgi:hypothetical protein
MSNSLNYTYIYFNVVDYTGNNSLSSFSLSNTPLTFKPDFTTSSILSGTNSISNNLLHWDFGDGTTSTDLIPTHNYVWPGQYTVTLTIYDKNGTAYDSSYQPTINIFDFVSTQIAFQDYKSLVYDIPSGQLIDPLIINAYFSWQTYQSLSGTSLSAAAYTINLYASGARGDYNYVADTLHDKWEHLRSLSRFYALSTVNNVTEYTIVDSVQPQLTPVYVAIQNNKLQVCTSTTSGSILAGVTGSSQFWYTDDRPANYLTDGKPIILFATVDSSKFYDKLTQETNAFNYINYPPFGFQNLEPAVFPNIKTRFNPVDHISITTTGIDGEGVLPITNFEIPNISWQQTEIPYVLTFKDYLNYTTKNYPPLSSSIANGSSIYGKSQPLYDVQTGIVFLSGNTYLPLSGVTFYEDFPQQAPQSLGAFYKGYFISSQSSTNCILTASVVVMDPAYYHKDSLVSWITIPQYSSALRIIRQESVNGFTLSDTISFTNGLNSEFNINNQNVYAIAVAPSGAGSNNDYQTWFADTVNDRLIKYDIYGNQLPLYFIPTLTGGTTTYYNFTLSSIPTLVHNTIVYNSYQSTPTNGVSAFATPSDMALDSNGDLWVSLLDSGLVVKITNGSLAGVLTGNYISTYASPNGVINQYFEDSSTYNTTSGFAGEGLILPSSIDTDQYNNIWVAYNHPDFNKLIKYQGIGNYSTAATQLISISFPYGITPEMVRVDRNQYVWVACNNHNANGITFNNRNDFLYKFDINGSIVPGFPLSGFQQIGSFAIDGNQNAWVVQGADTLTRVDGVLGTTRSIAAGIRDTNGNSINNKTEYICSIGGVTCDTDNNVWVINNFDQNIYAFNAIQSNLTLRTSAFNPKYTLPLTFPSISLPAVSAYTGSTPISLPRPGYPSYSDGLLEFQAIGDWNGYNWINKYAAPVSTSRTITGTSSLFNIYPYSGQYNIAKVNENWNAAGYYESLRYQESLINKPVFFEQFLGVILGGLNAQPYELGKTIYEKIANFVDNNADIDKVNISQLLSFCQELTVDYQQHTYALPPQVQRLIDFLSIKQSLLWGQPNQYALNFEPHGTIVTNSTYGTNLSSIIDPLSGTFTNGTPIIAQELFSGNYNLINTNLISNSANGATIPLSAYTPVWGWNLVVGSSILGPSIGNYYKFFKYNPTPEGTYYNNIIDWTNPLTTLSPTNSSYQSWSSDEGIIQNMLSYELTKGLRLFTSAVNITYNS